MDDYVIDQVDWYDGQNLKQDIKLRFRTIVEFLQANRFARRELINAKTVIDGGFSIRASDLTEEGVEFMKKYYSKWVRGIDRGKPPNDIKLLENGLKAMRAE